MATVNGEGQVQFISMRPRTSGDANAYDLSEVIPATWQLTGLACAVQTTVPTPTGSPSATLPVTGAGNAGVLNFEIVSGLETICEYTNSRTQPMLTLTKNITQAYGSTFSHQRLHAAGGDDHLYLGGREGDRGGNLHAGGEHQAALAGTYSASAWTCTGNATALNGSSLTIAAGETVSCQITNTGLPGTLIVQKIVINNNGGTKTATQFSFQRTGGNVTGFLQDPDNAGPAQSKNTLIVAKGIYTITEPSSDPTTR